MPLPRSQGRADEQVGLRKVGSWIPLVLIIALAMAACTGDREPQTAVSVGGGATPTGAGGQPSQPAAAMFGDLPSPCGPGDAKGATEQGVTDGKVVIGYGDDAGFSVIPGLSHELSDAVKAMIEWCNEQGGINGREIEGRYYDAKFTEVVNVMADACQQVFMLVGQGWANDTAQEETRLGCDLATVPGYSVSSAFANAPLMVQGVPNPIDINPSTWADQLATAFPDKIKKAAVMFANVAATIDTKDKLLAAFPQFGFEFLGCPQQYGVLGETDWRPFAEKLKDCGAEMVNYVGQAYPNFQGLLDAAAQSEYRPIWFADANNYDSVFAQWNTNGNGDQVYVRLAFTPFEEADQNPATKQYIDLVKESGGDTALLGLQATSSFLLWATAAKECGATLTRQCVMDNLKKVTTWTAGGLHAETNPGENRPPECGVLVKLDGTKWVRVAPAEVNTFDCAPEHNVELPPTERVVAEAELGPDRVSTKFTK